jgi:hypothetical protein
MKALTWITTKAKSIRRAHKNMTWKAAIKKAGTEYRASHKAKPAPTKKVSGKPAKKISSHRLPVKSRVSGKKAVTGNYKSRRVLAGIGSQSDILNKQLLTDLKDALHELGKAEAELRIYKLKAKRREKLEPFHALRKKRIGPYISHLKRTINSLKKQIK